MAIIFPNLNPVIISFSNSPLKITWYSLSYVLGILSAWCYIRYLNKKLTSPLSSKLIDDLITYLIIGIIAGGRLGYVIFYDLDYNLNNPLNIFKTWNGGMSFHGGLVGVIIATAIYCNYYKIKFFQITDLLACAAPIGLFFGRIANFINAELYGRATDASWGVIFPGQTSARHPSQIYEAFLEGALLFIIFLTIYNKIKNYRGIASGLFLILYAMFRSFVEIYREPDSHIGFIVSKITMGQLLSIPMIILGIYIIYCSLKNK